MSESSSLVKTYGQEQAWQTNLILKPFPAIVETPTRCQRHYHVV